MTLPFSEHLELLELHGRAAVAGLKQLSADDHVPLRDGTVAAVAREHWATLEIWAWSLENLGEHWKEREEPIEPRAHADVVAGIGALIHRLITSLKALGAATDIDFFGRPGTTAEVARLVAHEAIKMAHTVALDARGAVPAVSPSVGRDGVDHMITHWSTPASSTGIVWQPHTSAIQATDTGDEWQISLPQDPEGFGDFRVASPQTPAATVQGPAVDLMWWLQGYPIPEAVVSVSGNETDVLALKQTFLQPVPKAPRRWFGLRSG